MGRKKKSETTKNTTVSRKRSITRVTGMRDILPDEQLYWSHVISQAEKLLKAYGFKKLQTPVLEKTELYSRGVGTDTDIVEKEMYTFRDKGREQLTMKPEGTAGFMRAYIENGMFNKPQPVKVYDVMPAFRRGRPQAGRYRQFHQVNYEIIGDPHPVSDAESILITYKLLNRLGLEKFDLHVNSIGCLECRPEYIDALNDYFKPKQTRLSNDDKKRLKKNPLRLLDSKDEKTKRIAENAPQTVDYLCETCNNHLKTVLEYLDELEIPYVLNTKLVRGLDYYTKTVFEIIPQDDKDLAQSSLAGGGRYDNLAIMLGGRETAATGVAIGIERLIEYMKASQIEPLKPSLPDVFLVQLGELAKRKSLKIFADLEEAGIHIVEALSRGSIKSQLKMADKSRVRWSLILGQKEAVENTILIRDMDSGIQEIISMEKLVAELEKRLFAHPRREKEEYSVKKEDDNKK
ncbi:MAG: histidine--tRNA ligase [bacterium]